MVSLRKISPTSVMDFTCPDCINDDTYIVHITGNDLGDDSNPVSVPSIWLPATGADDIRYDTHWARLDTNFSKEKMRLYLAHPISGLTFEEVSTYYDSMKVALSAYYTVLSPMTGKGHLRTEKEFRAYGYSHPVSKNHAIIERDRWMVIRSDVVYVNLMSATEVSVGCVMELAWGHDRGKHTIVAMPEKSVHRHAFVLEAADIVFDLHEDAFDYLVELVQ